MAREIINLGSGPDSGTGDSARSGGDKINKNFEEVYGLIDILSRLDIIIEAAGFSLAGNDLTVNAGWQWYINNELYANVAAVLFEDIALSASGSSRLVYVVPNAENGFTMIDGEETTGTPSTPELPNGGMYVTYFTVTDSGIGTPADPYDGDSLVNKEDKLNKNQPDGYAGLDGDGKVFGLENVDNTADIDKPVSTAQALADADVLADANDYTDTGLALKLNTADYNDRYKGKYTSLGALETAHPTANAGDYAQVDAGSGSDVVNYNYDLEEGWIEGGSGSGATDTDALPEGSTNLYFTTARVLATVLTGLSLATGGDIVSTDSVLQAFGKIQKQINDLTTANVPDSTNKRYVTDTQLTVIGNTSGTNSGNETTTTLGTLIGSAGDATPNDTDVVATALTGGGLLKKITWTNVKAFLKTYFDSLYLVPQITITTSVSITTATNDASGFGQKGRNVAIDNSTNAINITVNGGTGFCASYLKHGSGVITFVQGSGRTMIQVDGTATFNGNVGSTATISSVGTTDYLRISNA